MVAAFLTLLSSTLVTWILIWVIGTFLLYSSRGFHGFELRSLGWALPYLPGIVVAAISGTTGALFNGLIRIAQSENQLTPNPTRSEGESSDSPRPHDRLELIYFVIRPILGAIGGVILFFFVASGASSLNMSPGGSQKEFENIGEALYALSPRTTGQLATLVVLSFIGGYFFILLPSIMRGWLDQIGKK